MPEAIACCEVGAPCAASVHMVVHTMPWLILTMQSPGSSAK